ncbi:hypothetical protein BCR39DRAFT_543180 [Naematelia encephala]|uniref:Uncharacterized protein n=1 Tax=Naematelia encephala TaxID=71784 RepID=A0A1Y2ATX7_9TREE|nr:hypothetical protein BCR39DRAFT_543180 [Naematelia encephala]
MIPYAAFPKRKLSTSRNSHNHGHGHGHSNNNAIDTAVSPKFSSAIVESPVTASSPQFPTASNTPVNRDHGFSSPLDPVDETRESGPSTSPLLKRDFALASTPNTENVIEESESEASFSFLPLASDGTSSSFFSHPLSPIGENKPFDTSLIPPESSHDAYLSWFMTPLDTSSRPNVARHSSAPGIPNNANAISSSYSFPSPLLHKEAKADPNPIYEIFDADLSKGADDLAKRLKSHLEDVLRVQEEIGRMHLGLEDLDVGFEGLDALDDEDGVARDQNDTPGDKGDTPGSVGKKEGGGAGVGKEALSRREKGVEDIMERLGKLSEGLRTYHEQGTPRLIFPTSNESTAHAQPKLRTQSISIGELASHRYNTTTPSKLSRPPIDSSSNVNQSPADLSPSRPFPKRAATAIAAIPGTPPELLSPIDSNDRQESRESNLSPLNLTRDSGNPASSRVHESYQAVGNETIKERDRGEEAWVEHTRQKGVKDNSSTPGRARQDKRSDSVGMVNRSRPW